MGKREGRHDVDVEALVAATASAMMSPRGNPRPLLDAVTARWAEASAVVGARLVEAIGGAWQAGWQPKDLARGLAKFGRVDTAAHRAVIRDAIALQAVAWRSEPDADARWLAQLDDLGAVGTPACRRWKPGPAFHVLTALWRLPQLRFDGDTARPWAAAGTAGAGGVDPKILDRVRALLAKAESTAFQPEADALTAKAQQLMARYAIDHAMVGGPAAAGAPEQRRIHIDDPYATAKSMLLASIAHAGGCHVVWMSSLGIATVFGFAEELDAVELLFTSLLLQASTAMLAAGAEGPAGSRQRSRGWRHSFLIGFSARISERLAEARRETVAEAAADHGEQRLLPVLASREAAVKAAMREQFPSLRRSTVSVNDGHGLAAGGEAADRADLGSRDQVAGRRPGGQLAR
jgi:hypothetical protein